MLNPASTTLTDRRGFVGLSLVALIVSAQPGLARMRRPRVLFVCQFGSVKSALAREIFRRSAARPSAGLFCRAWRRAFRPCF